MEQIVSQIVGPVVNILTSHITKHLGYVTFATKQVTDMRNKMKILEGKSKDVTEHLERNTTNNKEIPARVEGWLGEVENVKKEVISISSDGIGCLHMKRRYRAGRKAFKTFKEIERLISEEINWSDAIVPLGRVKSKQASTSVSSPSDEISQNDFKSRDEIFKDALKFLQQDDKTNQVIALCGMGGVGKTTIMEQLKKIAHDTNMFNWIVKVVIGQNPNMHSIQNDIALYIKDCVLPEGSKTVRADHLCKTIENLPQAKKKILFILDDVWHKVELKDIGLRNPLPNGVKLLITSRYSNICKQIAIDADSGIQLLPVDILVEAEAQHFFTSITRVTKEDDHELYQTGCDIVKRCGGLPLAIKLIGTTLKSQENIYVWRNALNRLKNYDFDDNVQEIIKISYEHMKDEDKEIFLHCSLFPEDSNVPVEDLTRYAWGLQLLKNVSTFAEARDRIHTCVDNLINANLLINSDQLGCIKMHDIVLAVVLGMVSKGDPAWIINHGDASKLSRDDILVESCKSISLTCMGMPEFPRDFKYPNLSLLQLMHGDLSLKFPEDFYENMESLKVLAYYNMQYPLLPRTLQCSINLKSLCLHKCKLVFDFPFVGDLVNLEVLSFAHCGIRKLPSTIGNLRKLKVLDLTGCIYLYIDDGVFRNLEKLEELYMRVSDNKAIRFTDSSFEELKTLSSKLYTLEVEFPSEMAWLKNMYFNRLDKFEIAMGCFLEEKNYGEKYSLKNTLNLVTTRSRDLWDSKINELFKKTEKLHLEVQDMIGLEDIVSIHPYDQHPFCNLRDLKLAYCFELKYLFSVSMVTGLRKLERLQIWSCLALEALVYNDGQEINSGGEMIKFEELKFLKLGYLPKLVSLFPIENVVELSKLVELDVRALPNFTSIYSDKNNNYALLNSQVKTVKLEMLLIFEMEKLEQIWACSSEEEVNNISRLRYIDVRRCNSIVNLFPTNPMRILNHLERLRIWECNSIEEIFNIDLEYVGTDDQLSISSMLRSIGVSHLEKLSEVWRIKGGENNSSSSLIIRGFEAVETIDISHCKKFRNLFTPIKIKFDMPALVHVSIDDCGESGGNNDCGMIKRQEEEEQVQSLLRKKNDDNISAIAFPSNLMHSFHNLQRVYLGRFKSVEVVFEIECIPSSNDDLKTTTIHQQPLLSNLQHLLLHSMDNMMHVWKCENWNKLLRLQKQSSFHNLTTITIRNCNRIQYFISPVIAKFLFNLKKVDIEACDGMEVVFETESPISTDLITTTDNQQPLLPNLHVLKLRHMKSISHLWRCNNWNKFLNLQKQSPFHNLTNIQLRRCDKIKYLFSPLMAKLFSNLKTIEISHCFEMEEVVSKRDDNDEDKETTASISLFPRLHSLSLQWMNNLKSIGGGVHNEFKFSHVGVHSWSLCQYPREIFIHSCNELLSVIPHHATGQMQKLQGMVIRNCESLMEVFQTHGINHSNAGGGASSSTNIDEGNHGTVATTPGIPRLENIKVSRLSNLMKLKIETCNVLQHVFTFSMLESLTQLEELMIKDCKGMKVIVKEENGDQRKIVVFPRLKFLQLDCLPSLEGFFLGMNEFRWPLLEKVMISICPQMMVFTCGRSTTPRLKYIQTHIGKHSLDCDLNNHVTSHLNQTWLQSSESIRRIIPLERLPMSFHNLIELHMEFHLGFKNIIPSHELLKLQKLERIQEYYSDVEEVFELEAMQGTSSESLPAVEIPNLTHMELNALHNLKYIWKSSHRGGIMLEFPNLTTLSINRCDKLEHVFTSSMVGSLLQLQELYIYSCQDIEVIVKDEEKSEIECDAKVKEIVLPCLKSLKLKFLKSLKGFWLGKDDLTWPSLDTLEIMECPELMVFTNGRLTTPALNMIDTSYGRCYTREDINIFIKTKKHEFPQGVQF